MMLRERGWGSTGAMEVNGSSSSVNGGAAVTKSPSKAKVAKRRVSLPAVSWASTWKPWKSSLNGGGGGGGDGRSASVAKSNSRRITSWGNSSSGEDSATFRASDHGMTDFRLIPTWSFLTQHVREPEERMKTSIGTLYVRVVEGRGLMASDLNGLSDPYVKLCLTGRYLSSGQEWSEKLRQRKTTKIIKYTLNPVWDEEFTMPVRRSGAILKVHVWDWDRSSPDDPLGHFEVKIGEELLCQQPLDMWYVLEAPRGSAQVAAEKKLRRQEQAGQAKDGGVGDDDGVLVSGEEDEALESPVGMDDTGHSQGSGYPTTPPRQPRRPKLAGGRRSSKSGLSDHSHETEQDERECKACIELRRKLYGEVRLVLWYQFDELAEACSHTWPEEPPTQGKTVFSPNQLYRKGTILWEMARPYVNFMKEVNSIVSWESPWKSLVWMLALVGMLVFPPVLIVVINLALMRIAVAAYLKHRNDCSYHGGSHAHPGTVGGAAAAAGAGAGAGAMAATATSVNSNVGPSPSSSLGTPRESGTRTSPSTPSAGGSQDLVFIPSYASRPPSPAVLGAETSLDRTNGGRVSREPSLDRSSVRGISQSTWGVTTRRKSSDYGSSSSVPAEGHSTGGVGTRNSFSVPPRIPPLGPGMPRSAPTSTLSTPVSGPATSFFGGSGAASPAASLADSPGRSNSNAANYPPLADSNSAKESVLAAGAAAKGGVMSAAGAGSKNIKKLLPARFNADPELQELYMRLGNTKKVPTVVNEVGKRLLRQSGPTLQRGLDKMGNTLIQVRQRFHPLNAKQLVPVLVGLLLHMLLQLRLYTTGRFNLYFVLLVVGQFLNKLYKRWGKSFVLGVKGAHRSYRTRQALSHIISTAAATAAASPGDQHSNPPSSSHPANATDSIVSNPFKFDASNAPAFAPPGTTPAVDPPSSAGELPSSHQRLSSSFFGRSSVLGSRRGSGTASGSSGGGGGGSSSRSSAPSPARDRGATSTSHSFDLGEAPSATPRLASTNLSRVSVDPGSAGRRAANTGVNAFPRLSNSGGGGGGGGGKRPLRWSSPWNKKGTSSSNSVTGGNGTRTTATVESLPPARDDGRGQGRQGDVSFSIRLPPRPPRVPIGGGGGRKSPNKRRPIPKQRVRWGRLLGASLTLICALAALTAAVFKSGEQIREPGELMEVLTEAAAAFLSRRGWRTRTNDFPVFAREGEIRGESEL